MWTGYGAHPYIHWLLGVKRPGLEADYSCPCADGFTEYGALCNSICAICFTTDVSYEILHGAWCFHLYKCQCLWGLQNCVCIVTGISLENNLTISSMGPQSPLDMKPDTANLLGSGNFSPTGGGGGGGGPNSPK